MCSKYQAYITCHYVYRTMIPQENNLNTKTDKIMAKDDIQKL